MAATAMAALAAGEDVLAMHLRARLDMAAKQFHEGSPVMRASPRFQRAGRESFSDFATYSRRPGKLDSGVFGHEKR
jgi:hypothetical protein